MSYSSAAVTTRSPLFASPGPDAPRDLILRAVRGPFKRLGADAVRDRVKSVKSTVNVQVAYAQRALKSNKLEPPVKTGAARAHDRGPSPTRLLRWAGKVQSICGFRRYPEPTIMTRDGHRHTIF
jgi:hypothetical protein